jgi:hypothetical protein
MSIHCSSLIPISSFDPDRIREELEKRSGIIRLQNDLYHRIQDPREWFLQLCSKVGTPVSQSAQGDIVLSVRDKSFGKKDSRTRGPYTNRKLGFHTDRCDVIAFLCLMPAKEGGENQVIRSQQVAKIIQSERPELFKILCQKFPYKRHIVDTGNKIPFVMQPIFSEKEGYFACSYLRVLIDQANLDESCPKLTQEQIEAVDFLDQVCERPQLQTKFTMQKGEILFLNNWTLLHRRTAFTDSPEPLKQRHLLRVWLSMPNSRPLDESFKENFGSTLAGAIRGGMLKNSV